MTTAVDQYVADFLGQLHGWQEKPGGGWLALCPAHDDNDPSLSVDVGDNGKLIVCCHARCETDAVLAAMGLTFLDLVPPHLRNGHSAKPSNRNGKPKIVATYDYRDATGRVQFQVVRYEPKDFRQRRPDGKGNYIWALSKGRYAQNQSGDWYKVKPDSRCKGVPFPKCETLLYRLPELIAADPKRPVFIVEGEKDADRLAKIECVATTSPGGAKKWKKPYGEYLRDRRIVLLPDNDPSGRAHVERVAASLGSVASDIKIINLPGLPPKGDVSDWLDAGKAKDDLADLVRIATVWKQPQPKSSRKSSGAEPGKPTIETGVDKKRVAHEAIAALAKYPGIYQRGRALVRVVRDTAPPRWLRCASDGPSIATIPNPVLGLELSDAAEWGKVTDDGFRPSSPPTDIVQAVNVLGEYPNVRHLAGIVESPILLPDGSILQKPGYHADTGLIYESSTKFDPVPESPSDDQCDAAVAALREIVVDFPFATTSDRAAWLAAALTPFARFAYEKNAPLILAEANVPGAGKGLLVDTVSILATGRPVPRMAAPEDAAEFRKRMTTLLISGRGMILFDNVSGNFGGDVFDAILTADEWEDRVLGTQQHVKLSLGDTTFFVTANNIQIRADTIRRTLPIRLDSPLERPDERGDFERKDLLGWLRNERPRLVTAALTILRGYCVAGRPDMGLASWGSFEGWSKLVRNAVVWSTGADPGENRADFATAADSDTAALRRLVEGWEELDPAGAGLFTAEIHQRLVDSPRSYDAVRESLGDLCRDGIITPRSIGYVLRKYRGRVVGGYRLESKNDRGTQKWLRKSTT